MERLDDDEGNCAPLFRLIKESCFFHADLKKKHVQLTNNKK